MLFILSVSLFFSLQTIYFFIKQRKRNKKNKRKVNISYITQKRVHKLIFAKNTVVKKIEYTRTYLQFSNYIRQ